MLLSCSPGLDSDRAPGVRAILQQGGAGPGSGWVGPTRGRLLKLDFSQARFSIKNGAPGWVGVSLWNPPPPVIPEAWVRLAVGLQVVDECPKHPCAWSAWAASPPANASISGYFQNYKYFDCHRAHIQRMFQQPALKAQALQFLRQAKAQQQAPPSAAVVAIHIRRGDVREEELQVGR